MVRTFCLSPLLHCLDTEWAIRLLVGTYVDEHLYEQALEELQNLPNTPENAEFIALYQAIIEGGLEEQEGSGKTNAALSTISAIAANSNSVHSALAESVLAVYSNQDYIRHGQPVQLNLSPLLKNTNIFRLIPNPASTNVVCKFLHPLKQNGRFQVFDFSGREVISIFVPRASVEMDLVISQLNTGIYFCRLEGIGSVQKLAIVK
ncbi:MAG: T9SS type A sorting domain-containing protein [Sphingobacteriales bacterium]|nr:MAG: T9SS type A sorting domain-containing protein [Sphingobacteriales bacterium]